MGAVPAKILLPPFPMPPAYRLAADVWRCDYCGGHRPLSVFSCEGCGAPRSGPLHSGSDVIGAVDILHELGYRLDAKAFSRWLQVPLA